VWLTSIPAPIIAARMRTLHAVPEVDLSSSSFSRGQSTLRRPRVRPNTTTVRKDRFKLKNEGMRQMCPLLRLS
jgi:hypothetical protein